MRDPLSTLRYRNFLKPVYYFYTKSASQGGYLKQSTPFIHFLITASASAS